MKIFTLLVISCFLSCDNKTNKKECMIDFEISKNTINSEKIVTNLIFHKNILRVSILNLKSDTLHFVTPYLIFAKEVTQQNVEKSDIIVKQFIPTIVTNRVINYYVKRDNKTQTISIDSSKTRDMKQYEFKLAPKEKFLTEYYFNCKESNLEKYKIFFFESNRFDSTKYQKIKYPENGYLEIKKIN